MLKSMGKQPTNGRKEATVGSRFHLLACLQPFILGSNSGEEVPHSVQHRAVHSQSPKCFLSQQQTHTLSPPLLSASPSPPLSHSLSSLSHSLSPSLSLSIPLSLPLTTCLTANSAVRYLKMQHLLLPPSLNCNPGPLSTPADKRRNTKSLRISGTGRHSQQGKRRVEKGASLCTAAS